MAKMPEMIAKYREERRAFKQANKKSAYDQFKEICREIEQKDKRARKGKTDAPVNLTKDIRVLEF